MPKDGNAQASGTAIPRDNRVHAPLRGILLTLAGSTLVTFNDAAMKFVVTDHPVSQALVLRSVFSLVPILILVRHSGGWPAVRWNSLRAQMICCVPLVGTMLLFMWSLSLIPIAIATIIFYLAPLFVTVLAPLLGEKVGMWRWGAVLIGFCGAAFVIEPGGGGFSWSYLIPVAAALMLAMRDLAVRRNIAGETALGILVFSTLALLVVTGPVAAAQWTVLSLSDYGLLAFSGLAFGYALFLLTEAFRYADASLVSPVKYSGVVVAAVLGYGVWGDVPSLSALFGAVLIVISVLVIVRRESLGVKAAVAGTGRLPR